MARRRVHDDNEMVSILDFSTENISYVSSSGSDYEMFDADMKFIFFTV
jgi:hypothetical protein